MLRFADLSIQHSPLSTISPYSHSVRNQTMACSDTEGRVFVPADAKRG